MYYRWTEAARTCQAYQNLGDDIGKWYRETFPSFLKALPNYYDLMKQGFLEMKDESSTPKQLCQRRMWQYQGRMLALMRQQTLMIQELRANFPQEFSRYMPDDLVLAQFAADVRNIDMGLLLKKYYPDVYPKSPRGN